MIYKEVQDDLFNYEKTHWLVQCISADFAMGKGIAVEFNNRYDLRRRMFFSFKNNRWFGKGYCLGIVIGNNIRVLNLVTKEKYYDKPTYETMRQSIERMKHMLDLRHFTIFKNNNSIFKIAMPLIGCGLDRLKWDNVREIILDVFKDDPRYEIIVCIKGENR